MLVEAARVLGEIVLRAGDTLAFAADRPHLYRTHEDWATLLVTIVYAAGETAP